MKVNGQAVPLEPEQTLLAFLTARQYDCKRIAVERNGAIVPRTEYETVRLADGDTLEIVQFVGGG